MENASKAVLISAGVLFVMLILALLIYAWGLFSKYYGSKDEFKDIKDVSKFNEQFIQYERDDVSGYELVSLANKVADYNFKYSNDTDARNSEGYNPITLIINFDGHRGMFTYDGGSNLLFTTNIITTGDPTRSGSRNLVGQILNEVDMIEGIYGSSEVAAKLAKGMDNIIREKVAKNMFIGEEFDDLNNEDKEKVEQTCIANYNKIAKDNITTYPELQTKLGERATRIYEYYEYYQFKRGIYNCWNVQYDNLTNRVSSMTFTFTGEIE